MPEEGTIRASVGEVMDAIERRTVDYAAGELGMTARRKKRQIQDVKELRLRDLTALVAVGSRVDLYIAYSFSKGLIQEIARRMTAELTSVRPEDLPRYINEAASELVNIVVGNSTAELAEKGKTLHLSPPVVLVGAKLIHRYNDAIFAIVTLGFDEGDVDIAFVGPQHLFDRNLNYSGTPA